MEAITSSVFVSVGRHAQPGAWHLGPQVHPGHELIVVRRGRQSAAVRGRRLTAGAGDVLFYPRGEPHEEWQEGEEELETVFLSFAWPDCPADLPLELEDAEGRIRLLAGWLLEERRDRSGVTGTLNRLLLHTLLAEYVRLWQHGRESLFAGLRRYTEQHLQRRIMLARLADEAGLSRYHYIRTYRARTGRTPMADVRRVRVERARDLILTTALPLKEIAQQVGLGDVYHMTRLFRRLLDVTPGSLRRHGRGT